MKHCIRFLPKMHWPRQRRRQAARLRAQSVNCLVDVCFLWERMDMQDDTFLMGIWRNSRKTFEQHTSKMHTNSWVITPPKRYINTFEDDTIGLAFGKPL